MKLVSTLLFILIVGCQVQSQDINRSYLINQTEVVGIIDSLPPMFSTQTTEGKRQWKLPFEYIDSVQVDRITYNSEQLKVNGFVVQPKAAGVYPCIIWNRGGVKEFGAINLMRAAAMLGKIANEGYVVIATQYRGNAGSEGQEEFGGAEIADVLNLIEVLGEVPKADTSRIGMFGGSRGGMMTYIALTKTDKIKAAAVLGAPSDKYASLKDRPSLENSLIELVEGYAQNKAAGLDKRSPIKWVDQLPKDVPILILHGNADWRVKSEQSLRMALELNKHRVPYRLMIFEGGDHGLSEFRAEFYSTLTDWFDKYLKENAPLPNMEFHGR
ncbi:MAG: prolyl oligopeptidase family serine peptidase [Bacteroidota bacterium]